MLDRQPPFAFPKFDLVGGKTDHAGIGRVLLVKPQGIGRNEVLAPPEPFQPSA